MGRDTARGLAVGRVLRQATTQTVLACDTAHCAPRHDAVRPRLGRSAHSLGSGCAPGAPNPVLDSVHCF